MAKEKANPQPDKLDKIPFCPSGQLRKGAQGNAEDVTRLGTFNEALTLFNESPRYAGLGLAVLPNWGLSAFAGDRCLNEQWDTGAKRSFQKNRLNPTDSKNFNNKNQPNFDRPLNFAILTIVRN